MFLQRIRSVVEQRWWRALIPSALRLRRVQLRGRLVPYGWPVVSLAPGSQISLGANVVLCSEAKYTALGVSRPVILRTLRPGAVISIGHDVGLSGTVVCAALSVAIGDECLIGADVMIFDNDFHPVSAIGRRNASDPARIGAAAVSIARNVFIGTGCIITKGVNIGEGSVIGAGSVVTCNVPAFHIAAGNPARVLGPIPQESP